MLSKLIIITNSHKYLIKHIVNNILSILFIINVNISPELHGSTFIFTFSHSDLVSGTQYLLRICSPAEKLCIAFSSNMVETLIHYKQATGAEIISPLTDSPDEGFQPFALSYPSPNSQWGPFPSYQVIFIHSHTYPHDENPIQ